MKKIFLFLFISASWQVRAAEIPRASDYDFRPEQIFSVDKASPEQNLSINSMGAKIGASLSDAVDWSALDQLNDLASQAYSELQKCYSNIDQLRTAYMSGKICSEANAKVRALHQSVSGFLASTIVKAFKPALDLDDQIGYRLKNADYYKTDHSEYYHMTLQSQISRDVTSVEGMLDKLPQQNVHPLLTQVLMEFVAAGYPINYGGSVKINIFRRMPEIVDSPGASTYGNPAKAPETLSDLSWVFALLDGPEGWSRLQAHDPSEAQLQGSKLILVRQAFVAARVLNHLSAGKMTCGNWGLWPNQSVIILGIYAEEDYTVDQRSLGWDGVRWFTPSMDFALLAIRLADTCDRPIIRTNVAEGSRRESAIAAIATVGAWRQLLSRWLN